MTAIVSTAADLSNAPCPSEIWGDFCIDAEDNPKLPSVTAEFKVPSGRLILAPFVEIDSFEAATKWEEDRDEWDLWTGRSEGRNARVLAHAAEHQIAFTTVDDCLVVVYRDEANRFILVRNDDIFEIDETPPMPNWTLVGQVYCPEGGINIFDRDIAIDLMTQGGSPNPSEELGEYIGGNDPEAEPGVAFISQLDVDPGQWQIHGGENFNHFVDRKALGIPEELFIWALFEKKAA